MASASLTPRQQRAVVAQVHVSAALLLAVLLLWDAAGRLGDLDRTALQALALAAAALALLTAAAPWVAPSLSPRGQRAGIWSALALATVPAAAAVTAIGFAAAGAWQLLLVAGVLAELGARRRVLGVLAGLSAATTVVVVLHLLYPVV